MNSKPVTLHFEKFHPAFNQYVVFPQTNKLFITLAKVYYKLH